MRKTVLIVDDDEYILETAKDILEEKGFEVHLAKNGASALEKAREVKPVVALLDIKLPDIEGIELLRKLKEMDPGLYVIILTGYASLENAIGALKEGAFDYLQKPIEWEKLLSAIERAFEKKKEEERREEVVNYYRDLSIRDSLTGLYNNAHFKELLEVEVKRSERYGHPLSLLMIDIDDFKKWQDKRGHLSGDRALKEIGNLIKSIVRGIDIVARYGGEEFAILMAETPKEMARLAAERVRKAIESLNLVDGRDPLTVSIGVAEFPRDAREPEELIEKADMALYKAKREGKNRVHVWDG
ncbi:MAG: diguanylate cyclase response regulator [Thermoplasmata archaeon]|nr:MAG: diguanylate cyclase response regulator [Thermoplasmata archaeon]